MQKNKRKTKKNKLIIIDRRTIAQGTNKPESGKMAFTLLTKKGNRQQVKLNQIIFRILFFFCYSH